MRISKGGGVTQYFHKACTCWLSTQSLSVSSLWQTFGINFHGSLVCFFWIPLLVSLLWIVVYRVLVNLCNTFQYCCGLVLCAQTPPSSEGKGLMGFGPEFWEAQSESVHVTWQCCLMQAATTPRDTQQQLKQEADLELPSSDVQCFISHILLQNPRQRDSCNGANKILSSGPLLFYPTS